MRPAELLIEAYSGDTIRLNITTEDDYSEYEWRGAVKADRGKTTPTDAAFTFGPTRSVGNHYQTEAFVNGTDALVEDDVYEGVWDIKVVSDDVTLTLLQGPIKIHPSVTR